MRTHVVYTNTRLYNYVLSNVVVLYYTYSEDRYTGNNIFIGTGDWFLNKEFKFIPSMHPKFPRKSLHTHNEKKDWSHFEIGEYSLYVMKTHFGIKIFKWKQIKNNVFYMFVNVAPISSTTD